MNATTIPTACDVDHATCDLDTLYGHSCADDVRHSYRPRTTTVASDSVDAPERSGGWQGRPAQRPASAGMTDRQAAFLLKLLNERYGDAVTGCDALGIDAIDTLSKREASDLIDRLLTKSQADGSADRANAAANDARTGRSSRPRKPNRYGGKCVRCGVYVNAEAGYLTGQPGSWGVEHATDPCPDVAPAPTAPAVTDGFYVVNDDVIVKVQRTLDGARLYGKVLDSDTGTFERASGAFTMVRKGLADGTARKVTGEDAAAYGHLYGRCMCCGRRLTDEDSIARGVGMVCWAKHFGG